MQGQAVGVQMPHELLDSIHRREDHPPVFPQPAFDALPLRAVDRVLDTDERTGVDGRARRPQWCGEFLALAERACNRDTNPLQ